MKDNNSSKDKSVRLDAQDRASVKAAAVGVLAAEADAIRAIIPVIGEQFADAVSTILACSGRVVVLGVGKSGHIAGKIAATLASTGTPAFFVNAGEASHGDMGMITSKDVVLALSNSGETMEVVILLPLIRRMNVPLIAVTGTLQSTLALEADTHLVVPVTEEACPLGLAPMSSTTATLAVGDALAVAIFEKRGFSSEDFALSHPGGALGRRLILRVADIMHTGLLMPRVKLGASLLDAIIKTTKSGLGFAIIVDQADVVVGIFTDGDLRRVLENELDVRRGTIESFMTKTFKKVSKEKLAYETLTMMRDLKINGLPVVDERGKLVGAINLHDLLKIGFN